MTGGGRHGGRRGAHVTPARTRHGGAPPSPWLARAQGGRRRPEAGGGGRGEGARPLAPRHDRVTSGAVPPMGFALGAVTRDPDSQWRGAGGGPAAAAEEERVAGGGGGQRQATPSRPRRARKTPFCESASSGRHVCKEEIGQPSPATSTSLPPCVCPLVLLCPGPAPRAAAAAASSPPARAGRPGAAVQPALH
ncbi:translation initiation factor IF-2-like [Gallus gallus]|uniref:translation initiation factor IF-2-like n=1 Tax=Gallus gallus TaxID=9031 RepID=UPI001F027766|nr:translation initiation factor IF-2-like [Gallus gallus]XP_046795296.1 translation initiation factor IF-2-like [Gallus gallus]